MRILFRHLFPVVAGLLLVLSGTGTLFAQTGNAYSAPPVAIEATAESPAQARQKAIDSNLGRSLRGLLESLTVAGDHARLPNVTNTMADAISLDYSLDNERTTSNKYMAEMTVRFDAREVDNLLLSYGLGHTRPRREPVLILPVYKRADGDSAAFLWEQDTNPWLAAWNNAGDLNSGLVPIVLPLGDIEDISLLTAGAAATSVEGGQDALPQALKIGARNGAPDVLIVQATGTAETGLKVTVQGAGVFNTLPEMTIDRNPKAFDEAVMRLRAAIDASWKNQGLAGATNAPWTNTGTDLPPGWQHGAGLDGSQYGDPTYQTPVDPWGRSRPMVILARFQGLDQWIDINRRLQGLPGVTEMKIQAITRDQAQLGLTFGGDVNALVGALAGRGLKLTQRDGMWYLENNGGSTPTPSDPDSAGKVGHDPIVIQ